MRLLVDENLSPRLCLQLTSTTDTAQHVQDATGLGASDETIFDYARRTESVVVTADTDFGTLLARSGSTAPSVILVRELLALPVAVQGKLLLANLDQIRDALTAGAIVVFSPDDLRVRPLPLR